MRVVLVSAALFALALALAPAPLPAPVAQAAAERSASSARVVYSTHFSKAALARWTTYTTQRWHAMKGRVARYDGGSLAELVAPVKLHRLQNFAVQAKIKVPSSAGPGPNGQNAGFGLDVGLGAGPSVHVRAGLVFSNDSSQDAPQIAWGKYSVGGYQSDSIIARSPLGNRSGYHTYRLEVRHADYTLLVDSKVVVHFNLGKHRLGPRIAIYSDYTRVTVASFTLFALPARKVAPPLPAVRPITLTGGEVGHDLGFTAGTYLTNEEWARLSAARPSDIDSSGRIIGYEGYYSGPFGPPLDSLYTGAEAFRDPGSADSWATDRFTFLPRQFGSNANFTQTRLPELGTHAAVTVFDFTSNDGLTHREGAISFSRGRFDGYLWAYGNPTAISVETLQSRLIAWAKIMYARMPKA